MIRLSLVAVALSALTGACAVFVLFGLQSDVTQSDIWTAVLAILGAVWGTISGAVGVGAYMLAKKLHPSLPGPIYLLCTAVATWVGSLLLLVAITGSLGIPWLLGSLVPTTTVVLALIPAVARRRRV